MNVIGAVRWFGGLATLLSVAVATPGRADDTALAVANGSGNSHGRYGGAPVLEIWKGEHKMELREGDLVVRRFRVALGFGSRYGKEARGDGRTPVGHYYVSDRNPQSRFRRFLGLSYPNADDAERGYQLGLINAGQWADIFFATLRGEAPPSHTSLGGRVGIHGYGGRPYAPIDWTEGCIAVSDDEIEYLFARVPVGTAVIINE